MGNIDPASLKALAGAYQPNDTTYLSPIRVNHAIIGLTGEVGELATLLQSDSIDHKQFMLELGDAMWYVAEGCNALGFDMEKMAAALEIHPAPIPVRADNYLSSFTVALLALTKEVGLLASEHQRWVYYGKYDTNPLGPRHTFLAYYMNVLWLLSELSGLVRTTLQEVCAANIIKLKARYPEKYTDFLAADENRNRAKEEAHITNDQRWTESFDKALKIIQESKQEE